MDTLQPGQTLGPYRVLNQVGQGGMATVYKAYHAAMDRYVALKVLPRQLAEQPAFVERFRQEARVIAKLEHPRILPVYDYGESEGILYLVMRYVEAGTLKERLAAEPITANDIDRFFTQLAEALDYAHRKGVIHRDLKPSNALLDAQGDVCLTDFGIAKLLEGDARFTTTGATIGTPAYMSPEQAQGSQVDQRTDIYALGVILYEMVTGQVPFDADTPLAVILKHINAPLPLPSSIKPEVAPDVERLLLKALAKDPADRFANMGEFLSAWKQCFAQAPTFRAPLKEQPAAPTVASLAPGSANTARTVSQTAPPTPAPQRQLPGWVWGLGAVGLVVGVLGILVMLGVFTVPETTPAPITETPTPLSEASELPPVTASPPATGIIEPTAVPSPAGPWTQWPATNVIYGVQAFGDALFTWGPGGLLQWNRNSRQMEYQYTTYRDGLPFTEVLAFLVDSNTREWWVATPVGLGRFNGTEWTLYNRDDNLDSDFITALAFTPQGLLIGTRESEKTGGGLMLFNGRTWEAVPGFPSAHDDEEALSPNITALLAVPTEDEAIQWWVGTEQGLGFYDGTTWTRYTTTAGLPSNKISVLTLLNGEVWVGTEVGAVRFNSETAEFSALANSPTSYILGITQDARGRLWFGTDWGVWRFDPATADWERFTPDRGNIPVAEVVGGAATPEGQLFWGSEAGLLFFDGSSFQVWAVPNVPKLRQVEGIVPHPDGLLWFFGDGPLQTYNPADGLWSQDVLPCDYCFPLGFDAEEYLWLGSGDLGVWKTTEAGMLHLTTQEGLPSDSVMAFSVDDADHVWLGTQGGGVVVWDGAALSAFYNAETVGLPSNAVFALMRDADDNMWVGVEGGLSHYIAAEDSWEHFVVGGPFEPGFERVTALAAFEDELWVGTNHGLYRHFAGEWRYWASPAVEALTVDAEGLVWLGFYYNGAARFDGASLQYFGLADGLPHTNVTDVYAAPDGAIWFATSDGIARYKP